MPRPKLPTQMKELRGTLRPSRVNGTEPRPILGEPNPPEHLSAVAARFWPTVTETLSEMRVLATSDGLAVSALCETLADLTAARDALALPLMSGRQVVAQAGARTYATTTKGGSVLVRVRPEVAMIADADRRLIAWMARFGLTPADRARVSEARDPARPLVPTAESEKWALLALPIDR